MQSSRSSTSGLTEAGSIDSETEREVEASSVQPGDRIGVSELLHPTLVAARPLGDGDLSRARRRRHRHQHARHDGSVRAVAAGTDLSVAPRGRLPGARGDSRRHCDPRAAASLSMDREHGRDRHWHQRHVDQRLRRGGGPAAIPDGRRARRRLRDVVPRPAVSRRAGGRNRVADLVHRHRLVSSAYRAST